MLKESCHARLALNMISVNDDGYVSVCTYVCVYLSICYYLCSNSTYQLNLLRSQDVRKGVCDTHTDRVSRREEGRYVMCSPAFISREANAAYPLSEC